MAKTKTVFTCSECGYETGKWLGKCVICGSFNTFEEGVVTKNNTLSKKTTTTIKPKTLKSIEPMSEERVATNITELDRVLSGGIVQGSLILVGGDPGIGKSTLLLQICENIGKKNKEILYVSGEESIHQIKLRAKRLKIETENLFILAETNMTLVENVIIETKPDLVIIDSIQTVYKEELSSSPGSITQTRECVSSLMKIAKNMDISIIIVGHVTKEGTLAGPKMLEHMVDTVIYFEGDRFLSYRLIRTVKNRFGNTNEVGVFEMKDVGLVEIINPSEYMLSGRPINVPGSVITCSLEGSRPILTEVQALVSYTSFGQPRRATTGIDYNRVVMLMAVLEKRCNMQLGNFDSYVNIAGGFKVVEPSLDAAVVAAIASSYKNKPINPEILIFGEIGLTGEIRGVNSAEKRVQEASKLGFKKCIIPSVNLKGLTKETNIRVFGVSNIGELLQILDC